MNFIYFRGIVSQLQDDPLSHILEIASIFFSPFKPTACI
jgi:hypothetical protein